MSNDIDYGKSGPDSKRPRIEAYENVENDNPLSLDPDVCAFLNLDTEEEPTVVMQEYFTPWSCSDVYSQQQQQPQTEGPQKLQFEQLQNFQYQQPTTVQYQELQPAFTEPLQQKLQYQQSPEVQYLPPQTSLAVPTAVEQKLHYQQSSEVQYLLLPTSLAMQIPVEQNLQYQQVPAPVKQKLQRQKSPDVQYLSPPTSLAVPTAVEQNLQYQQVPAPVKRKLQHQQSTEVQYLSPPTSLAVQMPSLAVQMPVEQNLQYQQQPQNLHYQQPSNIQYEQLQNYQYEPAQNVQYEQPSNPHYQQPQTYQYEAPSNVQCQPPQNSQHQQPSNSQCQQPSSSQHQHPQNPQYQQPQEIQYQQPQTSLAVQREQDEFTPEQLSILHDLDEEEIAIPEEHIVDDSDLDENEDYLDNTGFYVTKYKSNIPSNKVPFCKVRYRNALNGYKKRLTVTRAEIERRLSLPECLSVSLLTCLLRRARKNGGGCAELAAALKRHKIQVQMGRQRTARSNSFTALCEQEALKMANDLGKVNTSSFPVNSIVYEYLMSVSSWQDFRNMQMCVQATLQFMTSFQAILARDPSPVMDMDLNRESSFHSETVTSFSWYSKLTHGFGVPSMMQCNATILRVLTSLLKIKCPKTFAREIQRPVPVWAEHPEPNANNENDNTNTNGNTSSSSQRRSRRA